MILFLKLLLAHLLGDFVFQPDHWVKEKESKKHKSPKLYLHALLHGLLSMAFVAEVSFWPYAMAITSSHFLIDWIKLIFQKKSSQKKWFFIDQVLHLIIIVGITLAWTEQEIYPSVFFQEKSILLITAIVFLTLPASVLIRILISSWTPKTEDNRQGSLQNAGKYIGILERLFVFTFILTNHWEAIGFLLAAKSVFRFGDLRESRDRKLTEYVLIGTLLSFGLAVLVGIFSENLW
ncbi:MAG: DUF3307 domain-containing protein [Anditalea sp.]